MSEQKSLVLVFSCAALLFLASGAAWERQTGFLSRPVHDELHFMETVHLFEQGVSLERLRTYQEISGPLPFLAYGMWARVFGSGPASLRVVSVLVAFLALFFWHGLFRAAVKDSRAALFACLWLLFSPYFAGLSLLVYTDLWALCFLGAGTWAVFREKPAAYGVAVALGLATRQYLVFFPLAVLGWFLLQSLLEKKPRGVSFMAASLLGFLPLLGLMALWRGVCPQNATRAYVAGEVFRFHPGFLSLYVVQVFAYCLPFVWMARKAVFTRGSMAAAALASLGYLMFPVAPARLNVHTGQEVTGILHRGLRALLGESWLLRGGFLLMFFAGAAVLVCLARDFYREIKKGKIGFDSFLDLSVAGFLAVMPFSHSCWEKYFLPVLPLVMLRLLRISGRPPGPER